MGRAHRGPPVPNGRLGTAFGALYARLMLRCEECDREPRADETADDEWRCYSDDLGELLVFCPECAEREFGHSRPGSRQPSAQGDS